ncbi:MAG: sulfotransferase family 2 domain-containing protein [Parvibaculum sp.]
MSESEPSVTERYTDKNPTRRKLTVTPEEEPWEIRKQKAYILLRRMYHAVRKPPPPSRELDVIVSHRYRVIVVAVPKAGSRSIIAAFSRSGEVEHLKGSLDKAMKRNPGYRTIAFVRNPWDRAYSCYNDKIARLDKTLARAKRIAHHPGLWPYMGFTAYAEWLNTENGSDEKADGHWASQSVFFKRGGALRIDRIFQLEKLSASLDELRDLLGDPDFSLPRINVVSDLTGEADRRRAVFDERTRDLIARRYTEDIDLFEYSF